MVGLGAITVRVRIDGGDEHLLNTVNFCLANARYFGGGMMIAPDAKLNDGQLDVVNIGDIKTAKILLNAYTLYAGSHLDLKEVRSSLARRVESSLRTLIDTPRKRWQLPGGSPRLRIRPARQHPHTSRSYHGLQKPNISYTWHRKSAPEPRDKRGPNFRIYSRLTPAIAHCARNKSRRFSLARFLLCLLTVPALTQERNTTPIFSSGNDSR